MSLTDLRARCALFGATLLVALSASTLPASAAETPAHTIPAFGVGALRAEFLADFPLGIEDLGRMGEAGIGLYRARFREDQVLAEGAYTNWTRLDNLARTAAADGVELQAVLINMPLDVYTPPKTQAERDRFASFATAAVKRYGPSGSFWSGCGCSATPIRVWEVWNEPNIAPFWDLPNAAEYGALLRDTSAAVRAADPAARVMFGGLAYPSTLGTTRLEPNAFLRDAVAAAGAGSFDALALHNYRPNPDRAVNTLIADTVATLAASAGANADGSPTKQVWVNEFGRPTTPDDPSTAEDEAATSATAQHDWLEAFLSLLLVHRSDWNLGPVMWYSLRDAASASASWERQGLRRTSAADLDDGAKPSWDAYTAFSASADPLLLPGFHALTVERTGSGAGAVTSVPAGIDCGAACSAVYDSTTTVKLTASPAAGDSFVGWTGDCTGTAPCTVNMDAARSVGAEFAAPPREDPAPTAAVASVSATGNDRAAPGPAAAGGPDATAPVITDLALARKAFRAARSGPAVAAARGTRLTVGLSEAATITLRVSRLAPGRRVGARWQRLRGRALRDLPAGLSELRFRGWLAGRALRPGRYRLFVIARDAAGNSSASRSISFRVVR